MKRFYSLLISMSVLFSSVLAPVSVQRNHAASPSGLTLLASDPEGVTISLHTPDYEVGERYHAGVRYQQLTVPGYEQTLEAGNPRLPEKSTLIAVPPTAQLWVEVLSTDTQPQKVFAPLEPAPAPASLQDDLQPGGWEVTPNKLSYQTDGYFPTEPVAIVEDAWIRNQRVVRLAFSPFQYNPALGELLWHRNLQVRVHFQLDGPLENESLLRCTGDCLSAGPFDLLLEKTLLNAHQARAWRARPAARSPLLQAPQLTTGLTDAETRYKIVVDQDGLYRLTYADLQAAGLDVEGSDPQNFKLTSQGETVGIYVEGEGDGSFDPGDSLVFYGEKFRGERLADFYANSMEDWTWLCPSVCELSGILEKYTDENVYWLTVESAPSFRGWPQWRTVLPTAPQSWTITPPLSIWKNPMPGIPFIFSARIPGFGSGCETSM